MIKMADGNFILWDMNTNDVAACMTVDTAWQFMAVYGKGNIEVFSFSGPCTFCEA